MRKYEPQPAEYLLHAKLVAESVPSTKQARRGGQARNGVPAQRPCTPAYTCSQDQTQEVAVGSRRARDSHRAGPGPHTTLTDSADGGGGAVQPQDWVHRGADRERAAGRRSQPNAAPTTHSASSNKLVNTTKTLAHKMLSPVRL